MRTPVRALPADRVFAGTCAWSFDDWRDVFYPHGLPRNRWLEYYAHRFRAVEMDSSFYHMPSAQTVDHWSGLTPPGFRFCPKLPKTLSHEKRLEDPAPEISMMKHLARELGSRMGCALLQLPPSFHARPAEQKALRAFLGAWPHDVPLAVEFRHADWDTPHAASLLQAHGVAWVWSDQWPLGGEKRAGFGFLPVTAPHIYVRLLGDPRTKYGPGGHETHRYGKLLWPRETALEHWSVKLRHHADASALYVFTNNHYEGMAVETARRLCFKLGVDLPSDPPDAKEQLDLFAGLSKA
ncbi:MAG: DUF72 domain-containing protein [Chthoniobacterales bacterium]|nr:DUF72 domain-containing protein [Chthoniobacterales bacterium]